MNYIITYFFIVFLIYIFNINLIKCKVSSSIISIPLILNEENGFYTLSLYQKQENNNIIEIENIAIDTKISSLYLNDCLYLKNNNNIYINTCDTNNIGNSSVNIEESYFGNNNADDCVNIKSDENNLIQDGCKIYKLNNIKIKQSIGQIDTINTNNSNDISKMDYSTLYYNEILTTNGSYLDKPFNNLNGFIGLSFNTIYNDETIYFSKELIDLNLTTTQYAIDLHGFISNESSIHLTSTSNILISNNINNLLTLNNNLNNIIWSNPQIQNTPKEQMFASFDLNLCDVQLTSNIDTNWWPIKIDTLSECITLPKQIYQSFFSWFPYNNCTLTNIKRLNNNNDIKMCYLNETGVNDVSKLPLLKLKLNNNDNEYIYINTSYFITNYNNNNENTICIIEGDDIYEIDGSPKLTLPYIILGYQALYSMITIYDLDNGRIGMTQYNITNNNNNNKYCQDQLICDQYEKYDETLNRCIPPKCDKYFFVHYNEENKRCEFNSGAIIVGLLFLSWIFIIEIILYFSKLLYATSDSRSNIYINKFERYLIQTRIWLYLKNYILQKRNLHHAHND